MEKQYCPYCMTPVVPGEPCPNCGLTGGSYTSQPHQLPAGTMLADRYLLGRVLGEGGFGITYIGCDTRLELRVAVKEYYPVNHVSRNCRVSTAVNCFTGIAGQGYEKGRERFIREARTMARMDKTPQIVAVRDYFQENNTAYIVMEYVDGTTFKELVAQKGGKISAAELLPMVEPLFGALESMHALGLIHRDISPDNLMLENGMVRLLDFGCARESAAKGNETMTIVLKQGYSPVEQYQHKGQGPWTDVYSLAATMYYCLTGVTPPQALDRICDDELVPPRKLGADLTQAQELSLLFGMGLQPTRRFRSVREFYASLYQGVPVPVKPQVLYGPNYGQEETVPAPQPVNPPVEEKDEQTIPVTAPMEFGPDNSTGTTPLGETSPETKEQPAQEETAEVEAPKEAEAEAETPEETKTEAETPEETKTEAETPEEAEAKVEAPKETEAKAKAPKKAKAKAETPKDEPKETVPAAPAPKTAEAGEEVSREEPWHFPPVPDTDAKKTTAQKTEKKSKKKIWIPVAAACGLAVILAASIPLMLRQGSPDPTVPGGTGGAGSTVQATEPPQRDLNVLRLSGNCSRSLPDALADDSVDQIVLETGSSINYMLQPLVINKPVLIEEDVYVHCGTDTITVEPGATLTVQGLLDALDLIVQGNVEVSGGGTLTVRQQVQVNGGQVHVKSNAGIDGLLAVSGGGQVFVEDGGSMVAGCYLLESEDSLVAQEDAVNLDYTLSNVAIVDEEALFADAVHVKNYNDLRNAEFAHAEAIVIDGSITVLYDHDFPHAAMMISAEGELIFESDDTFFRVNTLINHGTLAGPINPRQFINYGNAETSIDPARLQGSQQQIFVNLGNATIHGMPNGGPVFNLGVVRYTAESERYDLPQYPFFCDYFLNAQGARLEVDPGMVFELSSYLGNSGAILVRQGATFCNYGLMDEVNESATIDLAGKLQNDGYLSVSSANFQIQDSGSVIGAGILYIQDVRGALAQDYRVACHTRVESYNINGAEREAATLEQLRAILSEENIGCIVIPSGAVIQVPEDLEVNTPFIVRGELRMAPGTTLSVSGTSFTIEGGLLEVDRLELHDASQLLTRSGSNVLFQPGGLLRLDGGSCGSFMHLDLELNGASVEVEGEDTILLADDVHNCGDHLTVRDRSSAYLRYLEQFSQPSQVLVESDGYLGVYGGTNLSNGATLTLRDTRVLNRGFFYMDNTASLVLEGERANFCSVMGDLNLAPGSSIENRAGHLEMGSVGYQQWEIYADIVNDGLFRVSTTNLGGHVVNRGEMQIAGASVVTVYGTLENLGVIYIEIEDDSPRLISSSGGTITGPAPVLR